MTMILNLVAGLVLVLGVGVRDWDGLGFRACPWVTMAVEYIQVRLCCCNDPPRLPPAVSAAERWVGMSDIAIVTEPAPYARTQDARLGADGWQLLLLWGVACQWLRLHAEYWPGWSLKHLTRPRLAEYCSLYFPAMLSLASDFWRLAFIGAVAATIGDTEVRAQALPLRGSTLPR